MPGYNINSSSDAGIDISRGVSSSIAHGGISNHGYQQENSQAGRESPSSTSPNDNTKSHVLREQTGQPGATTVDELQQHLGGYGRYQLLIFLMLSLVYMRGGWHVWVPIYQALAPDFHCSASPGLSLNESVPALVTDGTLVYAQCEQYVNRSVSNATEPCHNGWTYQLDSGYTSIVSWLDLVCDHSYQAELTTTMYMVGTTSGVIFLTPLADKFGSKNMMLWCLWAQAVFGTVLIWAKNIVAFCFIKFLIGMCNMTIALSAYVLMTETFDATHRLLPTIAMQLFWVLSIESMALLGYLIPVWQNLELAITLPINVLSVALIFLLPHSLPWLLSQGKVEQAERIIQKFIRVNRLAPIPDLQKKLAQFDPIKTEAEKDVSPSENNNDTSMYAVLTLLRTPRVRWITCIMSYLFLVNALAYFGIMYSTPQMAGNRFLNLSLLGLAEVPAYFISLISNRYIGRRLSMCIFLAICGACNLAVLLIPDETGSGQSLTALKVTLVIIGKFGITGSYSIAYLYASEVYPTTIRNQAVGASAFFENIGSIAAPNMVYVQSTQKNLPLAIFGGMTIVGSLLVLLLPETHNRSLPQTLEDVERMRDTLLSKTEDKTEESGQEPRGNSLVLG